MAHDTDYYPNQAQSLAAKANSWTTTSMELQAQLAVAYSMMAVARDLQAQRSSALATGR
jgi:hypothetical protein